jgi:factor associated with neutral sphingomyelinase activation
MLCSRFPAGTRQNRKTVGDVELPPWAHGSAWRFLSIMRAALEAPYVSSNLHHWLDLIFGFKQQGEAAVEADNVFHPLTYHNAVDIDKVAGSHRPFVPGLF